MKAGIDNKVIEAIAQLRGELDSTLKKLSDLHNGMYHESFDRLQKSMEKDRRDAERYRVLITLFSLDRFRFGVPGYNDCYKVEADGYKSGEGLTWLQTSYTTT